MGNNLSLIHLPAQSGKTRKMTDLINKWKGIIDNQQTDGTLNIVFTSNNKLLAKQTYHRVTDSVDNYVDLSMDDDVSEHLAIDDTEDTGIICRTYAWIHHSHKKGVKPVVKSKDVNDLTTDILIHKKYDNIICCTNKTRANRIFELINNL